MAVAQELLVNPSNKAQRYILWSNGYLQPYGGAPVISQAEQIFGQAPVAPAAPTFYWLNAYNITAAQVISWGATPTGYTFSIWGDVYNWGGATAAPGTPPGAPNVALFQPVFGFYSDFVMDPAGNGFGYALTYDGDVVAIGTPAAIAHSAFLAGTGVMALRLQMDWTSKRYWVIDSLGRVWGKNGGSDLSVGGLPPLGTLQTENINFSFALYSLVASAKGWQMNQFGGVYPLNASQNAPGAPFNPNTRIWQDIAILDDGTGANPLKLVLLNEQGGQFEYVVSTAPTVAVQTPADPTTTSTRPRVGWSYNDPEGDAPASWEVGIFTAAQYGIGGFDPAVSPATLRASGTDAVTRSYIPAADLANATYRAYVRSTDTSGLTSAWAFKQWVQNVTRPTTPTVTPSLVGSPVQSVSLLINRGTLITNEKVAVQYQDADDATWRFVQNGWDLVPDGSGNATVIDYGAGFGVQRTYRAIHYVYDATTDTWNASDWSTTQSATLTQRKWVLSTADLSDLLEVAVTPDFQAVKEIKAGIFWPAGRPDPIIVRDGQAVKNPRLPVSIYALTAATRASLEALLAKEVLLLRDPFGHRYYAVFIDQQTQSPIRAKPLVSETTPLRDANVFETTMQAVQRPKTGPTAGPLKV